MRARIIIGSIACLILATALALAAAKPNYSGTWVMDRNRSIGIPPDMEQTMTVTQSGDKMELEIKVVTKQGERLIKDTYTLDGKEVDFTPQGATGPTGKGKRKAYWLPDDRGIVISEDSTVDSPNGPVNTQQTRKWLMSADGSTLTIDYYIDGPRGSGEAKRIFVKK
jgi:hypothetical protein